jgi:hypothetical protein
MTAQHLPPELDTDLDRPVFTCIESMSAHSDVAEALCVSVKPLGDVQIFCPDSRQFRYVVTSTKGIVFGVAVGMRDVMFRLDDVLKSRAVVTGGVAYPDLGGNWVSFTLFRADWPRVDLSFWAQKAYRYAREKS